MTIVIIMQKKYNDGALGQYYSVDNPNTIQSSFESSTTRI